jgi:glycerate 2-kinase
VDPRVVAEAIWQAALAAGEVGPLLRRSFQRRGDMVQVGDRAVDLSRIDRVFVLGCGKAGAAMALAVEDLLCDRISAGFVVVKDGHLAATRTVVLAEAGHPVPDARGVQAARRLLELASGAAAADLVIVLVSGGGSALTPAPAADVSLAEKQTVTRSLLAAGAAIGELNTVRKHLSRFKGGQLARAAAPALVVTLVLSDVIGDPVDVIASGPTAPDPTTFQEALNILRMRGLLADAPFSVRERLQAGARGEVLETPKPRDPIFGRVGHVIIGNNQLVVDAAVERARSLGYHSEVLTRELQGEARHTAQVLVERARALEPPACLIAAGETTVTVRGRGRGGRCQEFALAAALIIEGDNSLTVLAAGTDGTDGPTDAAGAVVDGSTITRGRQAGLDMQAALDDNDSYRVLRATGDLIATGPTNTNLLDLYLVVRGPAR